MEPVNLNVAIAITKRNLKKAVIRAQLESNLPSYLMASILTDIRADMVNEEIADLIDAVYPQERNGNDNANEQS